MDGQALCEPALPERVRDRGGSVPDVVRVSEDIPDAACTDLPLPDARVLASSASGHTNALPTSVRGYYMATVTVGFPCSYSLLALIDTGAMVSVLRADMLPQGIVARHTDTNIFGIANKAISTAGVADIHFQLGATISPAMRCYSQR